MTSVSVSRAPSQLEPTSDAARRKRRTGAPNINLVRDGRWGRAGETSGEDVLLTTRYMLAWVRGLQGGSNSDKTAHTAAAAAGAETSPPPVDQALATCKHWSAYSLEGQIKPTPSGPAGTYPGRHQFDAVISKQDLVDFYFPVFESCAKDANVASVMCTISTAALRTCACPDQTLAYFCVV